MKKLLFISVLLYPLFGISQYNLTIRGKINDNSLGIDVKNPSIAIFTNQGDKFEIKGDSVGIFSLTASLNYDTLIAIMTVHARNQMAYKEKLFMILNSDSIINLQILMSPQEVCYDSFLPSPVFFKSNSTTLKDKELAPALETFFSENNNDIFDEVFESKSGIKIYCVQGLNEQEGIAQKRAEYMSNFFKSNTSLSDKVEIIIITEEDYFYCTNCNGCFEYFKYGQGIDLNKKTIDEFPQLDQLRQIIEIQWTEN